MTDHRNVDDITLVSSIDPVRQHDAISLPKGSGVTDTLTTESGGDDHSIKTERRSEQVPANEQKLGYISDGSGNSELVLAAVEKTGIRSYKAKSQQGVVRKKRLVGAGAKKKSTSKGKKSATKRPAAKGRKTTTSSKKARKSKTKSVTRPKKSVVKGRKKKK